MWHCCRATRFGTVGYSNRDVSVDTDANLTRENLLPIQAKVEDMASEIIQAHEFKKLFTEKYMQLYYFAFDYLKEEDECRDIVSEVFTTIWNRREHIDRKNINSYLYSCVRNKCIDRLRQLQRALQMSKEYPLLFADIDDEDWKEKEQRIEMMQAEIMKMSTRTRNVLRERYFNERSYKEIAGLLGISVDGVSKILSRAFAQLRSACNAKNSEN